MFGDKCIALSTYMLSVVLFPYICYVLITKKGGNLEAKSVYKAMLTQSGENWKAADTP